ncbi:HNH endonuclease [Angustibacter aerolatus]
MTTSELQGGARGARAGWQLSDVEVGERFAELARQVRALHAEQLTLLAEAEQRGLAGLGGHRRVAEWAQAHDPVLEPGAAKAMARRAHHLADPALAGTASALAAGAVSPRQVDVVVEAVRAVDAARGSATAQRAQAFLVGAASGDASAVGADAAPGFHPLPTHQLRRLATRLVARLDPGHDERLARDERLQHEQRHLDVTPLDGGTVAVRGLLTRGTGHALIALLDAHSAPAPAADGAPDPRSATQRRHDALGHLVDGGLLASGSRHGAPVRLVVTVPLDRLRGEAGAEAATIGEGVPVSDRLLGELACDADVVPVLLDRAAGPLAVGRTERLFTASQRRALAVRDGHCTWAGCTAKPDWCHAHHLVAWQHGGATDLDNAALLCSRHHHHVHQLGLAGVVEAGAVVWTSGAPPGLTHAEHRARQALDRLVGGG